MNMPLTPATDMPVTGVALYAGFATLAYTQAGGDVALLGQATLTAKFADQVVSGQITDVFGGTGPTDLQAFAGQLTIDGQIGSRRPNGFDAVVSGQLSGAGTTLAPDRPAARRVSGGRMRTHSLLSAPGRFRPS